MPAGTKTRTTVPGGLRFLLALACLAGMNALAGGLTLPPDTDADGIPDSADNCLVVPNPAQRDTDLDGYGNFCDPDFNNDGSINFQDVASIKQNVFTSDALHDLNGDGSVNFEDVGLVAQLFLQPPGPSEVAWACFGEECDNPPTSCNEGTEDPLIEVYWPDLPTPESIAGLPATSTTLIVRNDMPQTMFFDVDVVAALDDQRPTLTLGPAAIPPYSEMAFPVDLAAFGPDIGQLDFSGRLVARAAARMTPSGLVERFAYSPHGFLHVDPGTQQTFFYGVDAMIGTFHAGDYDKRETAFRDWARDRGIQLVGLGYMGRGLRLTEDDGGPREDPQ